MSTPSGHPSRQALLKAIKSGKMPFHAHLKTCQGCRDLYEMLQQYELIGESALLPSSSSSVSLLAAIPVASQKTKVSRSINGLLTSDSWQNSSATALRDNGVGLERRLAFEAGRITLEIVARRQNQQWEFIAQVYDHKKPTTTYALKAGKGFLAPAVDGFFHWFAKKPPKTLKLLSETVQIEFAKISW